MTFNAKRDSMTNLNSMTGLKNTISSKCDVAHQQTLEKERNTFNNKVNDF